MDSFKITVMMGLPGSGKSTKAEELAKSTYGSIIIDIDALKDDSKWYFRRPKTIEDRIVDNVLEKCRYSTRNLILDGLFLTNQKVVDILKLVIPNTKVESYNSLHLEIHHWAEDRETCVKNDGGRREIPSVTTILTAKYEAVDKAFIESEMNKFLVDYDGKVDSFKVYEHEVFLKPDWERFYKSQGMTPSRYMYSSEWCTGGTAGNCWDSSMAPISASDPEEFTELDNLLESIAPTLTFLQYKKINRECVSMDTRSEGDYYGGSTHYAFWVCDKVKLFELLEEMGYVSAPEE